MVNKRQIGEVRFVRYPNREGTQQWKWEYYGPHGDNLAGAKRFYSDKAGARRAFNRFLIAAHFAIVMP